MRPVAVLAFTAWGTAQLFPDSAAGRRCDRDLAHRAGLHPGAAGPVRRIRLQRSLDLEVARLTEGPR